MFNIVINNLLDRYFTEKTNFNIVCDNAYIEISKKLVESVKQKVNLYKISNILNVERTMNSIIKSNVYTLLLVEPSSFLEYSLYKWFDYSKGAPTINGVIAVDGALFFKKISTILFFYIKDGKIESIKAKENAMPDDLIEYENMTQSDFNNECNKQLAEIGLGFCDNAIISNCFMEAEAAYNTCHFCFGNNECYGGINKSNFHGASILIKEPQFEIIYD